MANLGRPPKPRDTSHDAEILARLASGESLRQIAKTPGMPAESSVRYWVGDDPDFAAQYARARNSGLDAIAEEIQEIADDATNDFMTRVSETGVNKVLDAEHVNRSRLRIDARKWLLSKLRPDKYGDDQRIQLTGAGGGPIEIAAVAETLRARRIARNQGPLLPSASSSEEPSE